MLISWTPWKQFKEGENLKIETNTAKFRNQNKMTYEQQQQQQQQVNNNNNKT